jgi:hypothetical protein
LAKKAFSRKTYSTILQADITIYLRHFFSFLNACKHIFKYVKKQRRNKKAHSKRGRSQVLGSKKASGIHWTGWTSWGPGGFVSVRTGC